MASVFVSCLKLFQTTPKQKQNLHCKDIHALRPRKGLNMMSVLDTTVFDESYKDPCGQTVQWILWYLVWCYTQCMTSCLVKAAIQSLRIVCDIMLRHPGENYILHIFWKDDKTVCSGWEERRQTGAWNWTQRSIGSSNANTELTASTFQIRCVTK